MPIIPVMINQHIEEASFIWLIRNGAISEPQYDLADLCNLDDIQDAHIDGLRIAGQPGWKICQEFMETGEPGEIFIAGVLAFESRIPERMDLLLASVETDDELKRALISAIGWIDFDIIAEPIQRLISADLPFLKYIGLAAHAVHRRDPGSILVQLLEDEDPIVRARALKTAGELARLDLLALLPSHFTEDNPKCRFYAAWSAALMGDRSALPVLKAVADDGGGYAQRACDLVVRILPVADSLAWLAGLTQRPEALRQALWGYGVLGDPLAVPRLTEMMNRPESARAAGEAFSMITGIDLDYEDLETDPPGDFEAGPTEDPEDEDVALDPDEDLPWPDPELIARWWNQNRQNYKKGTRYLCGQPISEQHCTHVLKHGCQRQRMSAALELALMKPDRPLFEVRAPGFAQRRLLGLAKRWTTP